MHDLPIDGSLCKRKFSLHRLSWNDGCCLFGHQQSGRSIHRHLLLHAILVVIPYPGATNERVDKKVKSDIPGFSFVELIHAHQGIVYRICSVYASTPEDREDLNQEILLQCWRSFASFRGDALFSTWLYRIALNTALLRMRKKKGQRDLTRMIGGTADRPGINPADTATDVELLYHCIQQLTAVDRAIILLYLEHRTYEEIAEITGLSRTNISVRVVRIKDRLRELLRIQGYEES